MCASDSKLRWNDPEGWVWSGEAVHDALADTDTFGRAQEIIAAKCAGRGTSDDLAPIGLLVAADHAIAPRRQRC